MTTPDPRDYRLELADLPEPSRLGNPNYDHRARFEDNQDGTCTYTVNCDCGYLVDLHLDDYIFSDDEDDWCDWNETAGHHRATAIGEWMVQLHDRGIPPLAS